MNLTGQQLEAVTTWSGRALVLAGAGSGKTAVLTERIAHLIERREVDPHSIMALSFTRKAARQIRERLTQRLGGDEAASKIVRQITSGTVHSVALQILQSYGDRLKYQPTKLTILNPDESDLLLETVIDDLKYRIHSGSWRDGLSMRAVQSFIERGSAGEPRGKDSVGRASLDALHTIEREFYGRLFAANCLTFGRILTECRRLLENHDDVLSLLRRRYQHVIVDEVQDSAAVEWSLFEAIAPPAHLFVVGDLRQSLYGFRHARPDILEELARAPDTQIIDLQDTFRCGDSIVECANRLTTHMAGNLARPMRGATGRVGKVDQFAGDWPALAGAVAREHARGYGWRDIAILARSHRRLDAIQAELVLAGIPFHRAGSAFDLCASDSFKALHSILRLTANQRDYMAWLRWCGFRGITSSERLSIEAEAWSSGSAPFAVWAERSCQDCIVGSEDIKIAELLTEIENRFGASFGAESKWWLERCDCMTLREALNWYGLHQIRHDNQEDMEAKDAVTLATVHAAKGLEWPCVIVAGANEGDLPSRQSMKNESSLAEERRIFYVAITRAIERVVVHYRPATEEKDRKPSRFIADSGIHNEKGVSFHACAATTA